MTPLVDPHQSSGPACACFGDMKHQECPVSHKRVCGVAAASTHTGTSRRRNSRQQTSGLDPNTDVDLDPGQSSPPILTDVVHHPNQHREDAFILVNLHKHATCC